MRDYGPLFCYQDPVVGHRKGVMGLRMGDPVEVSLVSRPYVPDVPEILLTSPSPTSMTVFSGYKSE